MLRGVDLSDGQRVFSSSSESTLKQEFDWDIFSAVREAYHGPPYCEKTSIQILVQNDSFQFKTFKLNGIWSWWCLPFDFEPNGNKFGSKLKGKLSPRSIPFNLKGNGILVFSVYRTPSVQYCSDAPMGPISEPHDVGRLEPLGLPYAWSF